MAIGIDDLDDDDIIESGNKPITQLPPVQSIKEEPEGDFVSDFLKTRGIDDLNKILFEDDNGETIERSWDDLSKEEKINILNTPLEIQTPDENGLTDDEIALLSQIRESNMSPEEWINSIKGEQIILEPVYEIDSLGDDEVYLLDLETRVGELSEEEGAQALSIAKQQGEELFKKQVEGIRKEYKEREELEAQKKQAEIELELLSAYELYKEGVLDAIGNFEGVSTFNFNFSDEDRNYLAEFMLGQDENNRNYLYEALQDPVNLTKAAWFILNGDDALEQIADYYNLKIKLVAQNQYNKGLEDGKNSKASSPKTVVVQKQNNNINRQYKSIDELDD